MFNITFRRKLPSLKTIIAITNDFGIVQHTRYKTPDLRHGYCLDDNARALALMTRYLLTTKKHSAEAKRLSNIYLSYINVCQKPDGSMHNFISFDNHFLEDTGSEDSFGRAIWGLGECAAKSKDSGQKKLAAEILMSSLNSIEKLQSPRAIAYCLLGLCPFYSSNKDEKVEKLINFGMNFLNDLYSKNSSNNWIWYENILSYSNALLPLALHMSASLQNNTELQNVAIKSFDWLLSQTQIINDRGKITPSPIGNRGWFKKGGEKAVLDQQPIDVSLTILASSYFYKKLKYKKYKEIANNWHTWFSGNNIEKIKIANFEDGYCYDGLQEKSTSQNHGAESVIAFLLAELEIYILNK